MFQENKRKETKQIPTDCWKSFNFNKEFWFDLVMLERTSMILQFFHLVSFEKKIPKQKRNRETFLLPDDGFIFYRKLEWETAKMVLCAEKK